MLFLLLWIFLTLILEYKYPYICQLVRTTIFNCIESIGIKINGIVYTLKGPFYLDEDSSRYNLIYFDNSLSHLTICWSLFKLKSSLPLIINKTFIAPGHILVHEIDEKTIPLKWIEGTPFKIQKGKLILKKRIIKSIEIKYIEINTGDTWPILN